MSGSAPTPLTTRPACCRRTVTSPWDSVLPPVMALTEYSSISALDCTMDSMARSVASTGPLPSLSARCSCVPTANTMAACGRSPVSLRCDSDSSR